MVRTPEQLERHRENMRRYRERHPDRVRETVRRCFAKNGAAYKENRRHRDASRRDEINEKTRRENRSPRYRFVYAKRKARQRGIEWRLTFDQFSKLISEPCRYCGTASTPEVGSGLDRIDCNGGYVYENVVSCCKECNVAKFTHFTFDEMLIIGKAIATVRAIREQGGESKEAM